MYDRPSTNKLLKFEPWFALVKNSVRFAGIPPIILMKIIIDEPLPSFSFVISSANQSESIEPVVNETMIPNAKLNVQLNTTGFTKKNAIAVLNTIAQPNVKYFVYLVICCLPNSPSSFCNLVKFGIIGVNSWITMEELI